MKSRGGDLLEGWGGMGVIYMYRLSESHTKGNPEYFLLFRRSY